MNLKDHYWKEFFRLKMHCAYAQLYRGRTEQQDRLIRIFLAISSSGSIGAWAIWRDYAIVWGAIIAGSQVVSAVVAFLPYRERLRNLTGLCLALDDLLLDVEKHWLDMEAAALPEREMRKFLDELRSTRHKAMTKHLVLTLPTNTALALKAEREANEYFKSFYWNLDEQT